MDLSGQIGRLTSAKGTGTSLPHVLCYNKAASQSIIDRSSWFV